MSGLIWKPFIPLELMVFASIIMIFVVILNRKNIINRVLIIILLFIITQRPALTKDLSYDTKMFDILFVIDRSVSMNAVDINNDTRLNAAKKSINAIKDKFNESYFTIISYDTGAKMLYPLTRELDIIDDLINKMDVVDPYYAAYDAEVYSSKSTLNTPYSYIGNYLLTEKRDDEVKRLLFFISDGEVNSNDAEALDFSKYKSIADLIDDGAVLGYGTENGGKIIINQMEKDYKDEFLDKNGYLKDGNGLAISKYNEQNLKSLADNMGLEYIHVDDQTKMDDLITRIQQNDDLKVREWEDIYYYFVIALLILSMIELIYSRRTA